MKQASKMRDFDAWNASIRNFEWMGGDLPGAMDVDMLIERRGRFLVLEGKPWQGTAGVSVPFGQYLALEALANIPQFDVYIIGEAPQSASFYRCRVGERKPMMNRTGPVRFPPRRFERTSREGLALFVKDWWEGS